MNKKVILYTGLLFLVTSVLLAFFSNELANKNRYAKNVQNTLNEKIDEVHQQFQWMANLHFEDMEAIVQAAKKNGAILLQYHYDSLVFWTSNSIPLQKKYVSEQFSNRIVKISNSYYYVEKQTDGVYRNIALITLKYSYPYENNFLRSGFHPDFNIPKSARISFNKEVGYPVYNNEGAYLFSVNPGSGDEQSLPRQVISTVLFFLGIIIFLYYLFGVFHVFIKQNRSSTSIIYLVVALFVGRFLLLLLSISPSKYLLFDPYTFADSFLAPSLGDLLINSILILFAVITIFKYGTFSYRISKASEKKRNFYYTLLSISIIALYIHAHYFSYSLVYNSNISLAPNSVNKLNVESLLSYLIIGINYFAVFLFLLWGLREIHVSVDILRLIQILSLVTALLFSIVYLFWYPVDLISVLFFYSITIIIGLFYYRRVDITKYSIQVLLVLIFSVYIFTFLFIQEKEKELVVRSSLALSLANEHDPVAEYLFEEITVRIQSDSGLMSKMNELPVDVFALSDYVKANYFSGYWNKYDMHITLCRPMDSVLFESPEYKWFHCYQFFDAVINDMGFNLDGTGFYYIDNPIGRISYLGRFPFVPGPGSTEITLFIELDAKLIDEFLGYPDLLLDEKLHEERRIDQYSYAKYYNNELVRKHGTFSYSLSSELFGTINTEYSSIKLDGNHHLLYKPKPESLIVISLPLPGIINILIGFSYIFLFNYLLLLIYLAVKNAHSHDIRFLRSLRNRIQLSILSILLLSFILIALSTIWLSLRNYKNIQNGILQEKIQSVLIELSHKLSSEESLSPDWNTDKYTSLNQLLIKFADVFVTDINLYDPDGSLLATSRYEVFMAGLQGEAMDPLAYYKLREQERAHYIQREHIGSLNYLSAYVPFYNNEGHLLAYLNLPYFTKEKELQASISALLVTILNIYVILMLIAIMLTILISDQITRPLEIIQMRFREFNIGNKYEQITYKRDDEIGNLVKEYNNMVVELEQSINRLAKSERESAWREMAKQIAHEIKNPLTPMRLSVQQLQRLWKNEKKDFEKHLNNVSATLIEQIDNLSAIASEFSNFAKMPAISLEEINLVEILKNSVRLFEGNQSVKIKLKITDKELPVNADKDQLSRVFINLIKNGVQSIPEDRDGEIIISLIKDEGNATITFRDNGNGIPDEVRSKMFMPNFTTKSSGMGLGLAIVKKSMEQMNGRISFESEVGRGTIFSIILPVK